MISTTDQRDMLRRSIKVMIAGQQINRDEKQRRKKGWTKLQPKYHAFSHGLDQDRLNFLAYWGKKGKNPGRWQRFIPEDFVDLRPEFSGDHENQMRYFQLTDCHTGIHLRAMNLAYAFIRAVPYRSVEQKANNVPPFNLIVKTIVEHQCHFEYASELQKALADWFLDHTEDIPADDWQMTVPDMRYKLRNISQGKNASEGLPKYEAEKERARQNSLGKARAASSSTVN